MSELRRRALLSSLGGGIPREGLIAEYLFNNNLLDTSGHNHHLILNLMSGSFDYYGVGLIKFTQPGNNYLITEETDYSWMPSMSDNFTLHFTYLKFTNANYYMLRAFSNGYWGDSFTSTGFRTAVGSRTQSGYESYVVSYFGNSVDNCYFDNLLNVIRHVTITHTSNRLYSIYIDGIFKQSYSFVSHGGWAPSQRLYLAQNYNGVAHYQGRTLLYNRVLNETEITQIVNNLYNL